MNKNKFVLTLILISVIVAGLAFYGGYTYGQKNRPSGFQGTRQFGQMGSNGPDRQGAIRMQGGGFGAGEIIGKDDKSITIKLRDGGSRIVFISSDTEVSKFASGDIADLEIGKTVMINGKTNEDGSITAQTIQLRPMMPSPTSSPLGQ